MSSVITTKTKEECSIPGCKGVIVHEVEKRETDSNGGVRSSHLLSYSYPQTFYCEKCGVKYKPTPHNHLRFALRDDIVKMNFN